MHRAEHLEGQVDDGEVVALRPPLSVPLELPQVHESEGGGDAEEEAARPPQVALLEDAHAHSDPVGGRVVLGQAVPRTRDPVEQLGHRVKKIEDLK